VQVEAEYFTPFQMHASFGPSCAVADVRVAPDPVTGVQATVWSQTQGVYPLRRAVAGLLGYTDERAVHVIYEEGAGCYGHDGADDVAGDAALLSRACGKPVRVQWSRQDEHGWEPLGPAMVHTMKGGVSGDSIVAWDHTVNTPPHNSRPSGVNGGSLIAGMLIGQMPNQLGAATGTNSGTRNAPLNYTFPNRLRNNSVNSFVNAGPGSRVPAAPLTWKFLRSTALRSLGGFSNSFANESFLGELAAAAGLDDLEVRLDHLGDPRAIAVVEAVRPAWNARPVGTPGVGAGLAFQRYETIEAYVAAYVEVTVDVATGVITVPRVVVAHDCGLIINPDGLINQIEGNVMQGVSRTLYEEVHFNASTVTTTVWNLNPPFVMSPQYTVLRFDQAPTVETILIDHPTQPAWGAGEPAIGALGGAISNAVYHAVGVRLRSLPMTPPKVLAALAAL
jgi:CO/xanthine dehydrogenase Mo-binding subunit